MPFIYKKEGQDKCSLLYLSINKEQTKNKLFIICLSL
jgi:hypothetical protein